MFFTNGVFVPVIAFLNQILLYLFVITLLFAVVKDNLATIKIKVLKWIILNT